MHPAASRGGYSFEEQPAWKGQAAERWEKRGRKKTGTWTTGASISPQQLGHSQRSTAGRTTGSVSAALGYVDCGPVAPAHGSPGAISAEALSRLSALGGLVGQLGMSGTRLRQLAALECCMVERMGGLEWSSIVSVLVLAR